MKEFSALTVIDACAGAGGKTLAMADLLGGRGRVFAYDVSARKLEALRRRGRHAGFNNIQTKVLPEGQEDEAIAAFHGKADIVLVDAPCSGWGVLRRSPDIKWRQDRSSLERLPDLQLRLLETYSKLVAPGGRLVFGVCTFRRSETLGVVEKFSQHHSEFLTHSGGYLGPGPSDGFFMHSWIRKA